MPTVKSDSTVWCNTSDSDSAGWWTLQSLTTRDDAHCGVFWELFIAWLCAVRHTAVGCTLRCGAHHGVWLNAVMNTWSLTQCCDEHVESDSMLWWTRGVWLNVAMNTWSLTQCCYEHVESDSMLWWTCGVWLSGVECTPQRQKKMLKRISICVFIQIQLYYGKSRNIE